MASGVTSDFGTKRSPVASAKLPSDPSLTRHTAPDEKPGDLSPQAQAAKSFAALRRIYCIHGCGVGFVMTEKMETNPNMAAHKKRALAKKASHERRCKAMHDEYERKAATGQLGASSEKAIEAAVAKQMAPMAEAINNLAAALAGHKPGKVKNARTKPRNAKAGPAGPAPVPQEGAGTDVGAVETEPGQ